MSLKSVIGQSRATGFLTGIIKSGRTASTYLFTGEPGVGKKTAALNFAKALNCAGRGLPAETSEGFFGFEPEPPADAAQSYDACDQCRSCLKIDSGTHPDLLVIAPVERRIKIEEIRTADEALGFRPSEGRKKVVVVADAETMNPAAANAFLKTLEEPPEDSIIILVTSRPDMLLPTIRSRCCVVPFGTLDSASCRRVLEGRVEEENLELAVKLSMGRPGLALSGDLVEERKWFVNLFTSMLRAEKDGWTSREDMDLWFEYCQGLLRDMAVMKITKDAGLLVNRDMADFISGAGKSTGLKDIINIHEEMKRLKGLLQFNLNKAVTWNYASSLLRKELGQRNA